MALDRQTDTTQQTQHIPHRLHPAVLTCFFRASSDCDCDDSRSRSRHQRINLTLFHPSSEPCSCRAHLGGSPKLRELDQGHRQRRSNQKTTVACKTSDSRPGRGVGGLSGLHIPRICYDCLGGANARFSDCSPTIFWAARKGGGELVASIVIIAFTALSRYGR
jgi:hypothetical protein